MAKLEGSTELEALLGELVRRARASDSFETTGEVLLDLEVDGVRCLLVQLPDTVQPPPPALGQLSAREQEIARMVAKGYPNKIIAAVLDISCWTVNTHLRRVFAKLGVHNRAAMVARLLEDDAHQQGFKDGYRERHRDSRRDYGNGHRDGYRDGHRDSPREGGEDGGDEGRWNRRREDPDDAPRSSKTPSDKRRVPI